MKITPRSSLRQVAAAVADTLGKARIRAVLTGGACATIYSGGEYQSEDLDLILQAAPTRRALDEAMAEAGFIRREDHYEHPSSRFFVEFPRGPLAVPLPARYASCAWFRPRARTGGVRDASTLERMSSRKSL